MNISKSCLGMRGLPVLAALAILIGVGCASGPPSELKAQLIATDQSIVQAEQSGAAKAALPEFQQAKDKRMNAEEALKDKRYDDAMRFARQAQVDAQFASRKSEAERAAQSATEVQKGHEALREETERKSEADAVRSADDTKLSVDR